MPKIIALGLHEKTCLNKKRLKELYLLTFLIKDVSKQWKIGARWVLRLLVRKVTAAGARAGTLTCMKLNRE